MPPDHPSICMLCMQCTLQLLTTNLAQNLPDQSKFSSYTPIALYQQQGPCFILLIKYTAHKTPFAARVKASQHYLSLL